MYVRTKHSMVAAIAALALSGAQAAFAQPITLPGAADAGRVDKRESTPLPPSNLQPSNGLIHILPSASAPEQSKKIHFTLHRVVIEGMLAFPPSEMAPFYQDYLDKTITLDTAWVIAAKITDYYQSHGYFLSRAYVPQQQIDKDGVLRINVVEGYIAEVKLDDRFKNNSSIERWITLLKAQKPITSDFLESVLLQINDIPGVSAHATLEPVAAGGYVDGAVRLLLTHEETSSHGSISFDNDGSKYLGPYETSLDYSTVLIPNELTTLHFTTTPGRELRYGTIKQHIPVAAATFVDVYGGLTSAFPGYTLAKNDVKSDSLSSGVTLGYQWIRQRQENLTTKLTFETRDTETDILYTPQTRDHIRALRANVDYEKVDPWDGYNQLSVTFSQGLNAFGSSEAGDADLSRANATPDFETLAFTYSRLQAVSTDWGLVTSATGQLASGALYSSEQFGYGGQAFGRAYDASEITGDDGLAGSVEMRYLSFDPIARTTPTPYVFFDTGAVFSDTSTQKNLSASSSGLGIRFLTDFGFSANAAVAFPIGQPIGTPIYGGSHDPRYIAELSYGF